MAAKPWQFQPSGSINIPLGASAASATVPDGFYLLSLSTPAYISTAPNPATSGGGLQAGNLGPFYIGVPIQGWPPQTVQGRVTGTFQLTVYAQAQGAGLGTASLIPAPPCP